MDFADMSAEEIKAEIGRVIETVDMKLKLDADCFFGDSVIRDLSLLGNNGGDSQDE